MPSLTAPPPTTREPWRRVGPPSPRPNIFGSLVRGIGGRHWTFRLGVAMLALFLLVLAVVINTVTDLLYGVLNPAIRVTNG